MIINNKKKCSQTTFKKQSNNSSWKKPVISIYKKTEKKQMFAIKRKRRIWYIDLRIIITIILMISLDNHLDDKDKVILGRDNVQITQLFIC